MLSLEEIDSKVNYERLTDAEIDYVGKRIQEFDPDKDRNADLLDMISILKKADSIDVGKEFLEKPRGVKFRHLIEKYLEYPSFPWIAAEALRTLCQSSWGFSEDYLETMYRYIQGVEWDDGACNFAGITCAAEYLHQKDEQTFTDLDLELIRSINRISMDPEHLDHFEVGQNFYFLMGVPWDMLQNYPLAEELFEETRNPPQTFHKEQN